MNPEELLYCETHEWVSITDEGGSKTATVGISKFAVEQLTDLVFMELPEPGAEVAAGDEFGEVESVKAVSSLYAPVAGKILEVNHDLPNNLETLSEDPYDKGWIIRLAVSDDSALSKLLDYQAYQKQCAAEE
ncbi:MAG TPA: glycine cleavage system protein GcvH [Planctomycetaceae bacterium]|nr:glycine cleavage system protein GcvH [Planctomycetaceae bacterium]